MFKVFKNSFKISLEKYESPRFSLGFIYSKLDSCKDEFRGSLKTLNHLLSTIDLKSSFKATDSMSSILHLQSIDVNKASKD